jgi:hypothetical protein
MELGGSGGSARFFGVRVRNLWSRAQDQSLEQYTFKIFCPQLASVGLVNARPIHASGSYSEQTTAVTGHPKTLPGRPPIILFVILLFVRLPDPPFVGNSISTKTISPQPTKPTTPSASSSPLRVVGPESGRWRRSELFVIGIWPLLYREAFARRGRPDRPSSHRRVPPR